MECYSPLNVMKGIILMVANISLVSTMCKALDQMFYFKDGEDFCPKMDRSIFAVHVLPRGKWKMYSFQVGIRIDKN